MSTGDGAQAYLDAYSSVMAELDDIAVEKRTEPGACGVWSVQDLMGHLAYWDKEQARELQAIAAGGTFVEESGDDVNAREVARRTNLTWDDVMREVQSTHDELIPLLIDPGEATAQYRIHEHWDEHLIQIREWKRQIHEQHK